MADRTECPHGDTTCPCPDGDACHYEWAGDSPPLRCDHCAHLIERNVKLEQTLNDLVYGCELVRKILDVPYAKQPENDPYRQWLLPALVEARSVLTK